MSATNTTDQGVAVLTGRTKRRRRSSANKRDGWDRDLWGAYLLDGPARPSAANAPPPDVA